MIVVTRHPALVALLHERGIVPAGVKVFAHAGPEDVQGQHVVGVLPLQLAALATEVTVVPIDFSQVPRGVELDIDTLRRVAGPAHTYIVTEV